MTIPMGINPGNRFVRIELLSWAMSSLLMSVSKVFKIAFRMVVTVMRKIRMKKNGCKARMICLGYLMNSKSLLLKLAQSCFPKVGVATASW